MEIDKYLSLNYKALTIYALVFQILQKQKVYFESKYRIEKKRRKITWLSKLVFGLIYLFQFSIL